jgi:excisionase family DNA binding protein
MDGETFTTEEAARELGVTPARVRQMILEGLIKTQRFGRAHVITPEGLETARNRNLKPGPKAPKAATKNPGEASAKKSGRKALRKGGKK